MSYPFFLMCPPSQTHRHSSLLMKIERAEKLTRCDSRAMSKRATEKRNDDDDDASPGRTPQKTHSLISCCYIKKVFKIIFSPLHHRLSSALNSTSTLYGASFLSVSHVFCVSCTKMNVDSAHVYKINSNESQSLKVYNNNHFMSWRYSRFHPALFMKSIFFIEDLSAFISRKSCFVSLFRAEKF